MCARMHTCACLDQTDMRTEGTCLCVRECIRVHVLIKQTCALRKMPLREKASCTSKLAHECASLSPYAQTYECASLSPYALSPYALSPYAQTYECASLSPYAQTYECASLSPYAQTCMPEPLLHICLLTRAMNCHGVGKKMARVQRMHEFM